MAERKACALKGFTNRVALHYRSSWYRRRPSLFFLSPLLFFTILSYLSSSLIPISIHQTIFPPTSVECGCIIQLRKSYSTTNRLPTKNIDRRHSGEPVASYPTPIGIIPASAGRLLAAANSLCRTAGSKGVPLFHFDAFTTACPSPIFFISETKGGGGGRRRRVVVEGVLGS